MKVKPAHYRGTYHVKSRRLVATANANSNTCCAKCGMTFADYAAIHGTARAKWTAGHQTPGEVDGLLLPEHHHCNSSDGAKYGNRIREPRSENWYGR